MSENSSENQQDFATLLQRVCEGSADAARDFLQTFGPAIQRVVRRKLTARLRTQYDSVDFEQAVWASFFAQDLRGYKFEGPEALAGYLARLARNKVVDASRQRQADKYDLRRERTLNNAAVLGAASVAARQPTPSQVAVANEEWDRLLAGQPAHHRRLLELRRQGYRAEEIAAELGVHVKTVRRVLGKFESRLLS